MQMILITVTVLPTLQESRPRDSYVRKEGKGRRSSQAHDDLLSWRGWFMMSLWIALFSSFENFAQPHERKERVTRKRWIYKKIEYLIVNSWQETSQRLFELINIKQTKVTKGSREISTLTDNGSTFKEIPRDKVTWSESSLIPWGGIPWEGYSKKHNVTPHLWVKVEHLC
jgi:hypothetical protein